jgi:hypothetical protein
LVAAVLEAADGGSPACFGEGPVAGQGVVVVDEAEAVAGSQPVP